MLQSIHCNDTTVKLHGFVTACVKPYIRRLLAERSFTDHNKTLHAKQTKHHEIATAFVILLNFLKFILVQKAIILLLIMLLIIIS